MRLFLTTDSSQLYKYLFKIKRTFSMNVTFIPYAGDIFFVVVYGTLPKSVVRLSQDPFYVNTKWRNFFHFKFFWWFLNFLVTFCSLFEIVIWGQIPQYSGRCPFLDPSRPRKWRIFRRLRQSKHFQMITWIMKFIYSFFLFSWFERRTS